MTQNKEQNNNHRKTNVSFFIPHIGCPHKCSFCDQRTISGTQKPPSGAEVSAVLREQAPRLTERGISAEIAFFGGSFTAIPRDYMLELLQSAKAALERFPCYSGIRCSTRPDCISEELLDILKSYGMTAIELGAQSMSDEVLKANGRGHSAEDVRLAAELIRGAGIELGLQMMTGLYLDTPERCLFTAEEFIKLKPRTVRIYPAVIIKGTHLGELYERGEFKSFGFEETVDLCAELLKLFESAGVRVIRMGLHASADVEREMLGGVYHPAFREIVESREFLNAMKTRLSELPKGYYLIYTDSKNLSKAKGQKKCNITSLAELGYEIDILPLDGEYLLIKAGTDVI